MFGESAYQYIPTDDDYNNTPETPLDAPPARESVVPEAVDRHSPPAPLLVPSPPPPTLPMPTLAATPTPTTPPVLPREPPLAREQPPAPVPVPDPVLPLALLPSPTSQPTPTPTPTLPPTPWSRMSSFDARLVLVLRPTGSATTALNAPATSRPSPCSTPPFASQLRRSTEPLPLIPISSPSIRR
jgi:hypothetical protein